MALAHGANHQKVACEVKVFTICSKRRALESDPRNELFMANQIVITEKTSQAKDVRAAVGSRYGDILPAEGHLFDLLEPEDVVPAWKRWSPILLRPEGLYGTRPAEGGNKATKLKAIREALRKVKRVWLATDCDREGQLIGQEILEHYEYRGQVMRVLFTAQDSQTIRDAFVRAKPNTEYASLYAAAVARRQADQIYNLSLTRTATVILGRGARGVIGVGRVKTPTLAIVCKRELEIRNFVPLAYFEVVATANVAGGQFQMRHAPQERIVRREIAQDIVNAARGFEGALGVRVEDKRQGPPKLHDLPSLQKFCSSRFGWPAAKTLEVAQELYDGQGKKIITYPRAEVRYLPEVRAITPSFPTSTRLTTCMRSGLAFRPTRRNCSTSSCGLIWPPSCPTSATGRQPQRLTSAASPSAPRVASPSISAGAQHSLTGDPPRKRATKRNCCQHSATARSHNYETRPLRTKKPALRRDTAKAL
jgi:hypothetical protein